MYQSLSDGDDASFSDLTLDQSQLPQFLDVGCNDNSPVISNLVEVQIEVVQLLLCPGQTYHCFNSQLVIVWY